MQNNPKVPEPMTMYQLFAKMFAHIAKEVSGQFGEQGKEAIRKGVWNFGVERGKSIAGRAAAKGLPNVPANYLNNYDMERSDDFTCENTYGEGYVSQLFTQCAFADQWMKDGTEEFGLLYCQMIDPSIAHGYNEKMRCVHEKHIFKDGVCTFCFRLKEDGELPRP
jgi:hypothetical protein